MPFSNLRGRALTCGWQWAARARTPLGLSGEYLGRWPTQHFEPVSCRGAGLMAPPGPLPELGPKRWSQGRPVLLRCRAFGQSLPVGSWAESGGGGCFSPGEELGKGRTGRLSPCVPLGDRVPISGPVAPQWGKGRLAPPSARRGGSGGGIHCFSTPAFCPTLGFSFLSIFFRPSLRSSF